MALGYLKIFILVATLFFGCKCQEYVDDAVMVATFASNGVLGEIEFFKDEGKAMARLFIQKPLSEDFSWSIHTFPPSILDIENPCAYKHIGPRFIDLEDYKATIETGKSHIVNLPEFKLAEDGGIMGRSLVLTNENRQVCALIRPSVLSKVYVANFYAPVGGTVLINQASFGATITSNLYYTDGSKRSTRNSWNIVEFGKKDTIDKNFRKEISRCKLLKKTKNLAKLSEFIGKISIGQSGHVDSRMHFVDPMLDPLEKKTGSLYIILYSEDNPKSILACGMIQRVHKKIAQANFKRGVSGFVRIEQESPVEPSMIVVGLDDLDQRAVSYGIDELPTLKSSRGYCSTLSGRFYDPKTKEGESRGGHALGDIGARHGSLLNRNDIDRIFIDYQINLFGPQSVEGRGLVIYDEYDRPIACANLKESDVQMVTAVASFNGGPLKGQMIFRQVKDDPKSETTIYTILYQNDKQINTTSTHSWKIHKGNVNATLGRSSEKCQELGEQLNPYKVNESEWYSCQCDSKAPMRCSIGDVSAKVGSLILTGLGQAVDPSNPGRYVFKDQNLPLSGPNSIIGQAVVIYSNDYSERRLVCSNIIQISEEKFSASTGL